MTVLDKFSPVPKGYDGKTWTWTCGRCKHTAEYRDSHIARDWAYVNVGNAISPWDLGVVRLLCPVCVAEVRAWLTEAD